MKRIRLKVLLFSLLLISVHFGEPLVEVIKVEGRDTDEKAQEKVIRITKGTISELFPPTSIAEDPDGNWANLREVAHLIELDDAPVDCINFKSFVTLLPKLHLHFDHLQLFNYTAEDLQRSVNAAITGILPGVERLCNDLNAGKLPDAELVRIRMVHPERPAREGRSGLVVEKGLPLLIVAAGAAVALIVFAYTVGSAIGDSLRSEEKKVDEQIREQNDLLRAQNDAMKQLIERLKRDVIVLVDRMDHIEEATRAHVVDEFERYLDELAYSDLKTISLAAHNHYWAYFKSLTADMQDELMRNLPESIRSPIFRVFHQLTSFIRLLDCESLGNTTGAAVNLGLCYRALKEGASVKKLIVAHNPNAGTTEYLTIDSNLRVTKQDPNRTCHQFGQLLVCESTH